MLWTMVPSTGSSAAGGMTRGWTWHRRVSVDAERFSYEQTTIVDIHGKRFDHTDANVLTREA